jgi:6-phosphogluconolactonase/glucosamine-6-phosphate isomerase/deaminase
MTGVVNPQRANQQRGPKCPGHQIKLHNDSGREALAAEKKRDGLRVIQTEGEKAGSDMAAEYLYEIADKQTVLFLSGGNTPANLYCRLAKEANLNIGAAAMVDERYGEAGHDKSNEAMIGRSGLTEYFQSNNIPFYAILEKEQDIARSASNYDRRVRSLLLQYAKAVAILGIGEDGHLAGIAPNRPDFTDPLFSAERADLLVDYFVDPKEMSAEGVSKAPFGFGERITMTMRGLSKMDRLIVLAFGEKKKAALSSLFENGPIEQVPARFIKNGFVAGKTILITDQTV